MKKLTLNETWEECLKMWQWIVRQKCPRDVWELKYEWLRKNGYCENHQYSGIDVGCFFCDYTHKRKKSCASCPAVLIDKNFRCNNSKYNWEYEAAAFLREITKLNKIRLAKKK